MPKWEFQPDITIFLAVVCNDLRVPNLDPQAESALINDIILDVGALEARVDAALTRLSDSQDHDGQMRHRALIAFRKSMLDAATRLRQEGLHPRSQGALW